MLFTAYLIVTAALSVSVVARAVSGGRHDGRPFRKDTYVVGFAFMWAASALFLAPVYQILA